MGDEEYQKKLRDLQKYVPFLENTIKRLKTETGKPREAQISKLQSLLVILTDTKKKLKYDALKKCEEVIYKLYEKVEKKPSIDTMHKYMCRNPPEDKFPFRNPSPTLENEVAFSVARQKLNKQIELTPASPSPPIESSVPTNPVVIPTEKVATERQDVFYPIQTEFNNLNINNQSMYGNNFVDDVWSNGSQVMNPINPVTLNWPQAVFNPQPINQIQPLIQIQPLNQMNQIQPLIQNPMDYQPLAWPEQMQPVNEPLFLRRNEINRPLEPPKNKSYDIWKSRNVNFKKVKSDPQSRELVDYSDNFLAGSSPKIDEIRIVSPPKPVPPPGEPKKIKKPIVTSLNRPPLSESDLQDLLLSSSNSPKSGEQSPLVNDDMDLDKLEELKAKLCKELEDNKKEDKKVTKPSVGQPVNKPKSPRVIERVIKEQDNIFGNLLSSIDEQIIVKSKEKDTKINKTPVKDVKSSIKKDDKNVKHKDSSKPKDKDQKRKESLSKTEISKLNEKVKSSYFKDDSKRDDKKKDEKETSKSSKEESKQKSKDSKPSDSKSKDTASKSRDSDGNNKDRDSKSKDSDSSSRDSDSKIKDSEAKTKDQDSKSKDSVVKIKDSGSKSKDSEVKIKDSEAKNKDSDSKTKDSDIKTKDSSSKSKDSDIKTKDSSSKSKDLDSKSKDNKSKDTKSSSKTDHNKSSTSSKSHRSEKTDKERDKSKDSKEKGDKSRRSSLTREEKQKLDDNKQKTDDSKQKTEDSKQKSGENKTKEDKKQKLGENKQISNDKQKMADNKTKEDNKPKLCDIKTKEGSKPKLGDSKTKEDSKLKLSDNKQKTSDSKPNIADLKQKDNSSKSNDNKQCVIDNKQILADIKQTTESFKQKPSEIDELIDDLQTSVDKHSSDELEDLTDDIRLKMSEKQRSKWASLPFPPMPDIYPKKIEDPVPKKELHIVDKIMSQLKESISPRPKDDQPARLSDKYPHKRKLSVDTKVEPLKDFVPPKMPEIQPVKLIDPRLRTFTSPPLAEKKINQPNMAPPFTFNNPQMFQNQIRPNIFSNEAQINRPPSNESFNNNMMMNNPNMGNRTPIDSFLGCNTPSDPFLGRRTPNDQFLGCTTPSDPYLGMGCKTPQDPFLGPNMGHRTPSDSFLNPGCNTPGDPFLGPKTPGDPFLGCKTPQDPFLNQPEPFLGNQTPIDQFSNDGRPQRNPFSGPPDHFSNQMGPGNSNFDIDMRDSNQRSFPIPNNFNNQNQTSINQTSEQFWSRNPKECFNRPNPNQFNQNNFNPRFQNFGGPRFRGNDQNRNNFQNEQNFNQYDLSQMNPIDFYDTEKQNDRSQNFEDFSQRQFRGRGAHRGTFNNRGQFRNIQWVNPIVREDTPQPKPLMARFPGYQNDDQPKDPRKNRFSFEEAREKQRYDDRDKNSDPRMRDDRDKNSDPRMRDDRDKTSDPRMRDDRDKTSDPRMRDDRDKTSDPRMRNRFSSSDNDENKPKRDDPRKLSSYRSVYDKKAEESAPKEPAKEIYSPLDSLYSTEKQKIGKGYGLQNFKIPKIRKSVEEEKKEAEKVKEEVKVEEPKDSEPEIEEPKTVEPPKISPEIVKIEDDKKPEEIPEPSTSKETKEEPCSEIAKSESKTEPKSEADEKLDMFNNFMKHIFNTCDSSVLLQYLDKCGFSLPQSKTKRIRRIIESDSESEEEEVVPETEPERKEDEPKEEKEETKEEIQEPQPAEAETPKPEPKTPEKQPESEEESDVIESVGERIKNRRRKQLIYSSDSSPEKPVVVQPKTPEKKAKNPPKTRRKNALELLQEDLRDMFISEGVLTATGKRMCRMMKEHQEQGLYTSIEPSKKKDTTSDDDDLPLARRRPKSAEKPVKPTEKPVKNPEKTTKIPEKPQEKPLIRKTRSSPRVILEKIEIPIVKSSSESETEEDKPLSEFIQPEIVPIKRNKIESTDSSVKSSPVKRKPRRKRRGGRRFRKKRIIQIPDDSESVKDDSESIVSNSTTKESFSENLDDLEQDLDPEPVEPEPESEAEPLEDVPEPAETKKKPVLKKKKNNWAHGVIKKDKRRGRSATKLQIPSSPVNEQTETDQLSVSSQPEEPITPNSEQDEFSLLKIDPKPDVNYYLDKGNRFDCKLCDYAGKFIVHHYRTRHPDSENMISRLNPELAEQAKIESNINKFAEIEPYDEIIRGKKRRTSFVCRFCSLTIQKEFASWFFDHVCSHTGEYRYSCEMCSFYTGSRKTLSGHCHSSHPDMKRPLNIVPMWGGPPNFRIVFGYLCLACNFTQLLKPNVEKHIKLSHPGEKIEIIKISMSSKPVNLNDLSPPEEQIPESEPEADPEPEPEIVKEKTPEPVKEPDLTAFLEPEDFSQREALIEEERRKKMEEISSNIVPRRSTLNFVEQLKNKLQNQLSEDEHNLESDDAIEIDTDSPVKDPPIEEAPQPDEFLKITSTCSLASEPEKDMDEIKITSTCTLASESKPFDDDEESLEDLNLHISDEEIEEDEPEMDITDVELDLPAGSKQKGVLDLVQRLAAQLQTPKVPENEQENADEKVIDVGAIELRVKNSSGEQLYLCKAPDCSFMSSYKISFTKHCSDNHTNISVDCEICKKEGLNLYSFTMTALFVHLFDKHKVKSDKSPKKVDSPPKIRLRRISGDLLSSKPEADSLDSSQNSSDDKISIEEALERLDSLQPTNSTSVEPLLEALNQPIIFHNSNEPIVDTINDKPIKPQEPMGFLQIKDVRTLTPEEENDLQPTATTKHVTALTSVNTPSGTKIISTKALLVPINELPKYLKKTSSVPICLNKKVPLQPKEVLNCNKTKKIFSEMLRFPKILDLYKCPIELCSFSTNNQTNFKTHFLNHRWCQVTLCVYCTEGVSANNFISHVDRYHAHCKFQCAYCFYRSISKNYLFVHQQYAHGLNFNTEVTDSYYVLKPKIVIVPEFSGFNEKNIRSQMLLPYQCAQLSCKSKFLIADDFMVHLHVFHKNNFECAMCKNKKVISATVKHLISHYLIHSIGRYQCKYCLHAESEVDGMFTHYSKRHANMKPVCYIRQFKNKNGSQHTVEDILAIDMDNKIVFDKTDAVGEKQISLEIPPLVASPLEPPPLVPTQICSSPTVTTTNESLEQNISSSSDDLKPIITNIISEKEPNTNKPIEIIDLSEEIQQTEEFNEPLVTLKHRSVESKNAVDSAIDPLAGDDFLEIENVDFSEIIPNDKEPPTVEAQKTLEGEAVDLSGNSLYKCGSTNCKYNTANLTEFKTHQLTCDIMYSSYNCYHCKKVFKSVVELCDHLKVHGIRRFFCDLCRYHSALDNEIIKHMIDKHNVIYTRFDPLETNKKDMEKDVFIVRPLKKPSEEQPTLVSPSKVVMNTFELKVNNKNIFGPEDIDLLPRPPVYASHIKCKLCNYNTKVRSNMQRHLQQHIDEKAVPETAPVNPVPCLEKNEKMFDKMTNLAASSHYGRMGGKGGDKTEKNTKEDDANYPGFIPANKRYVCGAENCNYLTHGDTMLRHHLTALHADETVYKCPHCQKDFPADVDGLEIDQILFHLKMHDLHLYKCQNCEFIHYQKHKLEKHLSDIHPEDNTKIIVVVRELDNSANVDERPSLPVSFTETENEFKAWRCGFCSYKTVNRADVINHAATVHNIKSQFKCGYCNFRCSAPKNFTQHNRKNHPDQEINMISVFYKISEEDEPKSQDEVPEKPTFDTTPLWLKNKSGVKHIRGILLEESKATSKRTPKIIEKLAEIKSSFGEGTSKNVEEITKNLFGEKETKKTTKEVVKTQDFTIKYPSNYGFPDDTFYVCPSCEIFKTKSVKDFIGHLHAEMNYYRCACTICEYRFVDISQAKLHWAENHKTDGKEEKITPLTPDGKVENWVDNCIRHQHKKMRKEEFKEELSTSSVETLRLENVVNITPSKTENSNLEIEVTDTESTPVKAPLEPDAAKTPSSESPVKLNCQYCQFNAKTVQTLRKHQKRHYINHPIKCNLCTFGTFSHASLLQHHRGKHKDVEVSYTEVPQPDGPTIRPLKRKRHQNDENVVPAKILATEDIKTETGTEEMPMLEPEITLTVDQQNAVDVESKEKEFDVIFVCFHCPRKSEDLETIRAHVIASHEKHKNIFKYKKVTIDKNKKQQYKCIYCDWLGHPDGLKQHHLENHSDRTWVCQKATKFKCVLCEKVIQKLNPLKKHFTQEHPNQNICYQTILEDDEEIDTTELCEEVLTVKSEVRLKCEYCSDSFLTSEQLLSHHNLLHSHLELKTATATDTDSSVGELKKFKCPQCGHASNSYPSMRDHLRAHNKPYECTHCSMVFSYPSQLKSHHLKEHSTLDLQIKENPDIKKLIEKLRDNLLFLNTDGSYSTKTKGSLKRGTVENVDEPPSKVIILEESPKKINVARKSTSLPARPKNVAKKSTSNRPLKPEGFSFYGTKPCDINDYKNVMSEINIMGKSMPINVVAMSHVLNLFPTVIVEDCKANLTSNL